MSGALFPLGESTAMTPTEAIEIKKARYLCAITAAYLIASGTYIRTLRGGRIIDTASVGVTPETKRGIFPSFKARVPAYYKAEQARKRDPLSTAISMPMLLGFCCSEEGSSTH